MKECKDCIKFDSDTFFTFTVCAAKDVADGSLKLTTANTPACKNFYPVEVRECGKQ